MIYHVSNGLKKFIEGNSAKAEISVKDFVSRLKAVDGITCDCRSHRLVVTNWGHDYVPEVHDDNYRLVSERVREEFGWSMMLRAGSDSEYRASCYYRPETEVVPTYTIEDDATINKAETIVSFTPELRGAGRMPKGIMLEILAILGYKPHDVQLPEMLVKVKGHYWPDADAGMIAHPDVVDVVCFVSEATAYAQWFDVTESDYRNIARGFARYDVEQKKGVVLLPSPVATN